MKSAYLLFNYILGCLELYELRDLQFFLVLVTIESIKVK